MDAFTVTPADWSLASAFTRPHNWNPKPAA